VTREDWKWAAAMMACAVVMACVGYTVGHRTGTVEAEARCPVRPEDFSAVPDCTTPDGHPVRCDKGLDP
jgi:hypothetical protein